MNASSFLRLASFSGALLCAGALAACGNGESPAAVSSDVGQETPAPAGAATSDPGAPAPPAPDIDPETVILVVNGEELKQADFNRVLNEFLRGAASRMPPARLAGIRAQLREQIEERLITDVLLGEAVVAENLQPTDAEVAAEWGKIEKSLPEGMTVEQALAQQGYDRAVADKAIRQMLGINKLYDKIGGEQTVSDEEAKAYYDQNLLSYQTPEQVSARHILYRTDSSTPEEKIAKKKEIDALREKLVAAKGEGFEEAAKEKSDCPSRSDGGSLGEFGRGAMVPEFDKTAFELPVGEISPVIETQFGYHIIKVDKKTEAGTRPYEDVAESIKKRLASEKQKTLIDAYREELKKGATIERPGAASGAGNEPAGAPPQEDAESKGGAAPAADPK
jgi:peptidyl-prolyl cis-trans isomerase C